MMSGNDPNLMSAIAPSQEARRDFSQRAVRRKVWGWGHFPVEECEVYRPERLSELQEIVAGAPQASLIARGMGRSYGDASLNRERGIISSERLDRVLAFDPELGELECETALSLAEIIDLFMPAGFFFPVTPGTKYISIGGAIAADVHGKNHHADGSIGNWLISFRLLTANGEIHTCSREQNADLFWATIGGMGLTGFVIDARLRLKHWGHNFMTAQYDKAPNLDAALELFLDGERQHTYSVAWIDTMARGSSLGRSVLMRANHSQLEEIPPGARYGPPKVGKATLPVPFLMPSATLNTWTLRSFNEAFYRVNPEGRSVTDYDTFLYQLDRIQHWNRFYGRRGAIQYQVVIPPQHAREGLIEILETISSRGVPSFLGVLKPFGAAGDGLLSFPRPGHTLSVDFPNTGAELFETIAELDQIVLRCGGAVYLAKDSCLRPDTFAAMYPNLQRFRDIKEKVDPNMRFSSSQARRLRIVEPR